MADLQEHRQHLAKILRTFRKVHRLCGAFLFISLFSSFLSPLPDCCSGGKSTPATCRLAKTRSGISTNPTEWLPIATLQEKATKYFEDSVSSTLSSDIDRIDFRPEKGIAKIIFKDHYHSLQVDVSTGEILNTEKRWSDLIEHIHDGSVVDLNPGLEFRNF